MSSRRSPQRRHDDFDDAQPIVEILTEPRAVHIREQIAIRRGQHTHVDRPRAVLTDAPHLALLQDAQQLHLHGRRHVADFIKEQRAAIGGLEETGAILRRARE